MKRERIIKIIISILLLIFFLFLRTHPEYYSKLTNAAIIRTILSLLILLISIRTIIEITIVSTIVGKEMNKNRTRDNILVGLKNLYTIIVVLSVFLVILSLMGLDLKQVFTSLSIVAAAIAIVTKEFIAEIIIGIINGFSSKIEIDDIVEYNDQKGKIVELGLQKITLLTEDDEVLYVANSKFYNADIVNYTKRNIRSMSVDFQMDINKIRSVEELEKKLILACQPMEHYLVPDSYNLKLLKVSKDVIDFKFQYVLKEVRKEIHRQVRRIVLRTVANIVTK